MESFKDLNITPIPREQNTHADLLVTSSINFLPSDQNQWTKFSMEIVPYPSILDNVENFLVFVDDQ